MSIPSAPNNPNIASAKALLGVRSKRAKRDPSPQARQEVVEARRALAAAKLEAHIAEVVDASPSLTPVQRDKLSLLLRGTES